MRGIATDVKLYPPLMVKSTGVDIARFVLHVDDDYAGYINGLNDLGVQSAVVIDRDTLYTNDWESCIEHYAQSIANKVRIVFAGNEPDGGPPSSFVQSPKDFNQLGEIVARRFRKYNANIIVSTGGFSSGVRDWLRDISLDFYDVISIHPYFKRPDNFMVAYGNGTFGQITRDYEWWGKPVIIGEWGVDDDVLLPNYIRYGLSYWGSRDNFMFCLSDLQVPKMGLFDVRGQPKAAFWQYASITRGPSVKYDVGEGVMKLMDKYSDEPRSDEVYFHLRKTGEVSHSVTEGKKHRYRWTPDDGVQLEVNGVWSNG